MKKKERIQMLKKIQEYSSGPRPMTLDNMSKLLHVPIPTIGRWRRRLFDNDLLKATTNIGVNTPPFLYNRKAFEQLDIIKNFIEKCKVNKKDPGRYVSPLFTMCRTISLDPRELITSKNVCESKFSSFDNTWASLHPNKTTERYSKALRKFIEYNKDEAHFDLDESVAVPGGSQSNGDYATVHLTDKELTFQLKYLEKHYGWEASVLVGIFHEIFPRPEAAFSWIPTIEQKWIDVDGKTYEYAETRIYEPKQEKYYDKLILDPRVLKMIKELNPNKPLVSKESRSQTESVLSEALREVYVKLGKMEAGEVYDKGQPGWLYSKRPIYTQRHSSATMWVRRTNFNFSLVASMGWEDVKTLTKYYARNTTQSIMAAGVCYFCKPPSVKTDKAVFCSAPHALAYLNKTYGETQP